MLAMLPLALSAQKVWDFGDYKVTKISNPNRGEGEADGLIAGGDRQNSYTWRLAGRGDEIYIATARNIASALVNIYGSQITASAGMSMDTFWALIDAVTNGDIVRNDVSEGANIIAYNRKTGEFRVAYTAEDAVYQRMALTFGDNLYFGSYSANPSVIQYIMKLDQDGNFTKVFETPGATAMRANCEYDGSLFFASVDARSEIAAGDEEPLVKMAVLRKSNDDDTVWERVADYKDFGTIPYDPIQSSWAGAPFWELASHAGYIYATAPSTAGFVIFKGRPAQDGESANEYGWHWEEVAGTNNGINNPGLSDVEGGEPGTMRSLIGSVYEFNGELYAYNFDHAFGGEAQAFVGMLQQLTGSGAKPRDYLSYMYNSLHNPQKVWKLNDATGKFEELTAFTELMEGTTNEYIWRMGEHNGKLYVATMDAGIFYNYLTQLTNGSFLRMTKEERQSKLAYIGNAIQLLSMASDNEVVVELATKLEQVRQLLSRFAENEQISEEDIQAITDLQALALEVLPLVAQFAQQLTSEQIAIITPIIVQALENSQEKVTASVETLLSLLEYLNTEEGQQQLAELREQYEQATPEERRQVLTSIVELALTSLSERIQSEAADISERIDVQGLDMYAYINKAVMDNEWGFDLLRTADGGQSFEVITRNGFDDKYNYGCPSFLSTEEGLYFGTCNPFYGGQLFLLSDNKGTTGIKTIENTQSTTGCYYDLQGRKVAYPTKGIYIKDSKKVVVDR